jgi:hypothetical protein
MGNLGPHGWEGPVYDPDSHTLLRWEAGAIQDRKFPVDNGAFAFASELLGTTIKGPRYWPTDISGGENEFISLIVPKKEDLEPLCYNWFVGAFTLPPYPFSSHHSFTKPSSMLHYLAISLGTTSPYRPPAPTYKSVHDPIIYRSS